MTTVNLPEINDLKRVWPEVGRRIQSGAVRACYLAAEYGVAQGARAAQRSKVNASRTYAMSFLALRTPDGGIFTNKAEHSIFVEVGRKPGKAPPLSVIGQWMALKRIVKMPPKTRKTDLANARGQANRARASKRREQMMERYQALAWRIAMKIKHKGFKGRFIIRGMLPLLGKRLHRETRRQLDRITRDPPR